MTDILYRLARWAEQHPKAMAGDHAGEELLEIVRSITPSHAELAPHKIMTRDEYRALTLKGWHMVCLDVDGCDGVGIRYLGHRTPQDPPSSAYPDREFS